MPKLVGIAGLKTSGKDTTFQFVQKHNEWAQRVAFADKLKIMAARALGLEGCDDELMAMMDDFKQNGDIVANAFSPPGRESPVVFHQRISGRQYLQLFGSNARKVFGDTFWIDQILPTPTAEAHPEVQLRNAEALAYRYPNADLVVVTDVRYPNEAQRIRALGGVVWKVWRPGVESDGHDSEIPIPGEFVNWTIPNDGSIEDLERQTIKAMEYTL